MKPILLFLFSLGALAMAAAPDSGDVRQTAARQEQIRAEAQLLVARLDEVIADYTRNSLASGEDFEALKAVRDALGALSDDEMEQVVRLLKGAGDAGGDRQRMAKAYATQKDISLRLKQILAAHELNQDIAALASGARQLADRQSANLSAAIDTAQLAAQDKSANGQAAVTASQQAQQSEQTAIAGEAKLLGDKLIQIAPDAKYIDAGLKLQHAEPEADAASDALGAGKMDDAILVEKVVREQLDEVARALMPAGGQEPGPTRQFGELADLAHDQRDLLAQTTRLSAALQKAAGAGTPDAAGKALNEQIKRQEEALAPRLSALAAAQAALAAKAQMVSQDLRGAPKEAAVPMAAALAQMSAAQQSLAIGNGGQAARQEAEAASQLDQAQRLSEEGGPAAAQAQSPEQQVKQLQAGVKDMTARETASLQQGDALKSGALAIPAARLQTSLAGKALALEQVAAQAASPSALPLRQAADALQDAAKAMSAGGPPTEAEAAQQSALKNLAEADRQLAQQADGIARQKQDFGNMLKQMAGLDSLVQRQQQLDFDTQKAVDEGKAGPPKARQFSQLQAAIQKSAQTMRQTVNTGAPEAAKALDHADAAMGDALQKLADQAVDLAEPPQQAALAALYQAQDALADQLQKAAQALGQSFAPGRAAITAALDKAQAQAASARQAMAGSSPADGAIPHAAVQLAQSARAMAEAATQPQSIPQAARDALRDAQQSLTAAAASAAAGQTPQAESQSAQAGKALEAAQSALGQAQAGIAGMSFPSEALSGNGPPSNSKGPGPDPGMTQAANGASEKTWNDKAGAPAASAKGASGAGQFQALPERDRAALQQSQSEKYPQEYGSMIEEYMRSLASDSGGK